MKNITLQKLVPILFVLLFVSAFCCSVAVAGKKVWQRKEVNWRISGGSRIKAVNYPQDKPLPTLKQRQKHPPKAPRKKTISAEAASGRFPYTEQITEPIIANVIDSPPIDGFVPWIAVSVTDKRYAEMDIIFEAEPATSVVGNYLTSNPQSDFAIGLFDTGASAHVMGNAAATQAGIFSAGLITSNIIPISGATGTVNAWVSEPLGIYVDGIGALEPNGMLLDTSTMVGEWNTSIAVGQGGSPDLPTAIGAPLSVYFAASFRNDLNLTVNHNSEDFNGPDIFLYDLYDPCVPTYSNLIPLELRPLGGISVQYIPTLDIFDPLYLLPAIPSTIIGNLSQSLFFVHSVDLYDANNSAFDKDRFMFDTGAQITVIGSRIAARLNLDPDANDFSVEIVGVTGDSITAPGFYIDSIDIPALGEWLSFTNVPVVLLDIYSPEGGTVDGIIGMNLFADLNFVFRGGGLFLQDDPAIEYGPIPYHIVADITPRGGDGIVDHMDLNVFAQSWLATSASANWNHQCNMAPASNPDDIIDFLDFAVLADHWLETIP